MRVHRIVLLGCLLGQSSAFAAAMSAEPPAAVSQAAPDERAVRAQNAVFWEAFNRCDADGMASSLTPDVEFYHDREGMNQSREMVTASMLTGPCHPESNLRMRREAVAGSEQYSVLAGGFALLSGEHRFLTRSGGGPERHDSIARYHAIWEDTPEGWQMRRVVSYDHRADVPQLIPVPMREAQLAALVGRYRMDGGGEAVVSLQDGTLNLVAGPSQFVLVPLADNVFGTEDRWLQFRFAGDGLEIVEEGRIVATASR